MIKPDIWIILNLSVPTASPLNGLVGINCGFVTLSHLIYLKIIASTS